MDWLLPAEGLVVITLPPFCLYNQKTEKEQGIFLSSCAVLGNSVSSGEGEWAGMRLSLQVRGATLTILNFSLCFYTTVTPVGLARDKLLPQAGFSRSSRMSLLTEMLAQIAPVIPGTGLDTSCFALSGKASRWKDVLSFEPTAWCWRSTNISMNWHKQRSIKSYKYSERS